MRGYRDEQTEHAVVSTWIDVALTVPDATTDTIEVEEMWQRWALQDLSEVAQADLMIAFTDGQWARGGRHVELGYALALGIPVALVGPKEHIFHSHPLVTQFQDWQSVRRAL